MKIDRGAIIETNFEEDDFNYEKGFLIKLDFKAFDTIRMIFEIGQNMEIKYLSDETLLFMYSKSKNI